MARKPSQSRSIATVQAIVEAGEIVLAEYDLNAFTTRKVAEVAGVGVGSLYEYFDDKNAVLRAVIEKHVNQIAANIEAQEREVVRMPLRQAIQKLLMDVRELLEANDQKILKGLSKTITQSGHYPFKPLRVVLAKLAMNYLMHHPQLMHTEKLQAASYVTVYGGMYTVMHYLTDPKPPISYEELIDTIAAMAEQFFLSQSQNA